MMTIELPLRLVSEANAHEHWRKRHQRAEAQKHVTRVLLGNRPGWIAAPLTVRLTRIAPRKLDSDNAVISAKHVRDAIAAWLGIDDKHDHLVEYVVGQEKGAPGQYAVRVEISRRAA